MTDHLPAVDELRAMRSALTARIDGLTERRDIVDRALAVLAELDPAPAVAARPDPKPKPKPAAKQAAAKRPPLAAVPAPKRRGGAHGTVDYAEVARIAIEAHGRGVSMNATVAEHYGIDIGAAKQRVIKARNVGHPIPFGAIGNAARMPARTPAPGEPSVNLDAVRDVLAKADAAS